MIQIKEYTRPASLAEVDAALSGSRNATVIGGGAYLRLGRKFISTAIDLSHLGLNTLENRGDSFVIGAMTTFGELERSTDLKTAFHGLFSSALANVVGVQFRNMVTVGATVFSRYGFSDLIPALLALRTDVVLHRGGRLSLEDFLQQGLPGKDILTHIELRNNCSAASYQAVRLSTGDYAALNLVLAQVDGCWRVAVGARPGRAVLAQQTMALLNRGPWDFETVDDAARCIAEELTYGTNARGSAAYRRQLAGALLLKAIEEVQDHAG